MKAIATKMTGGDSLWLLERAEVKFLTGTNVAQINDGDEFSLAGRIAIESRVTPAELDHLADDAEATAATARALAETLRGA